ncbi:sensor domain-containing phosphodiesterase [Stutzerimonas urumqiensis]|uniref:sensor domain-containing phosphodiesterase n=1 Tax=Stutzerimonas urumqiensis TaxID=638269 RepID=UPI003DA406D0
MNMHPEAPINEAERLARVRELRALEETADHVLDHIVHMTTQCFDVPMAMVSIVDEHRQWFLARIGVTVAETPRERSFCSEAIKGTTLFEVIDADRDERFESHPMVVGPPGIRFYAAMPLTTADGLVLGALCIIDTQRRPPLTLRQASALAMLAKLVMIRIVNLRTQNYVDQPSGLLNRSRLEQDARILATAGKRARLVVIDALAPSYYDEVVRGIGLEFVGDLILSITVRLQGVVPPDLALYRVSPTRFAFLLPDETDPAPLCEDILACFETPVGTERIPVHTQVGIGVLPIGPQEIIETDWLRAAIATADETRERGHGWRYHDPSRDHIQLRAVQVLNSLCEAVYGQDQLHLHYQPRIDLHTGACTSVEALLRWQHPTLGTISPGEFIPLAEKTALMRPLSLWVMEQAMRQIADWEAAGLHLRVAMNVSAIDLDSPQFAERMHTLLDRFGLDPRCFELEFTESALMRHPELVRTQLQRIRDAGVEVSIDDFGTGYSNWTYLRALPADTVKLDQSFMRDLSQPREQRLVRTIIDLSRELGYRVVAEGIETPDVLEQMRAWGCHEGQGYLFARPMPPASVPQWLSARG